MKEILDIIVTVLFVFMVFMFIRGFNKQQIKKHTDRLAEVEKRRKESEDKVDE